VRSGCYTEVMARRRITYRKRSQNGLGIFLAVFVMVIICVVVALRCVGLHSQLKSYEARSNDLQKEISAEKERSSEISDYAKYTQTDEYVEEIAREKLGLVKKGEIIFRNKSRE
jgi:cell division protein DivIC